MFTSARKNSKQIQHHMELMAISEILFLPMIKSKTMLTNARLLRN